MSLWSVPSLPSYHYSPRKLWMSIKASPSKPAIVCRTNKLTHHFLNYPFRGSRNLSVSTQVFSEVTWEMSRCRQENTFLSISNESKKNEQRISVPVGLALCWNAAFLQHRNFTNGKNRWKQFCLQEWKFTTINVWSIWHCKLLILVKRCMRDFFERACNSCNAGIAQIEIKLHGRWHDV